MSPNLDAIRVQLSVVLNGTLVDELLATYVEAKRNHYWGGHRLSAVEGGRFCEAVYRILEEVITGSFTPLGRSLNTEKLTKRLANHPPASAPDAIRLHIPRSLRVIYDIRNKRDAAHLADGIDPNMQDSNLVVAILDWVLAELVRIYHNVTADEAYTLITELVTRTAPAIENFDGFLKVLNPNLRAGEHCLVLLYHCDQGGATRRELNQWARPGMRRNLQRTLDRLEHQLAFVHRCEDRYRITSAGKREVERRRFLA